MNQIVFEQTKKFLLIFAGYASMDGSRCLLWYQMEDIN